MSKFWYQDGKLKKRIGQFTWDLTHGFIELQNMETGEYIIKHISQCELIKPKK